MTVEPPELPDSEDALLAIDAPEALFPADLDKKQRKRRYLKLVKRFSPERAPEAFAHLRALYEGIAPARKPVELRPNPEVVRASDTAFRLLQSGLFPGLARVLNEHWDAIRDEQPAVWEASVRAVLLARVTALDAERLRELADEIDGRPATGLEQEIDELALLGLAIFDLAEDPDVPDGLADALSVYGPAWNDPDEAWQVLVDIGRLAGPVDEADALWAHIEAEHPAVLVALHGLGQRVGGGVPAVPEPTPVPERRLVRRLRPGAVLGSAYELLHVGAVLAFVGLMSAVIYGSLRLMEYNFFAAAGLTAVAFFSLWPAANERFGRPWRQQLDRAFEPTRAGIRRGVRAQIENWCVAQRLFPWEAGPLLLERATSDSVGADHALLAFARDVGALPRILARLADDGVDRLGLLAHRGVHVPEPAALAEEGS